MAEFLVAVLEGRERVSVFPNDVPVDWERVVSRLGGHPGGAQQPGFRLDVTVLNKGG